MKKLLPRLLLVAIFVALIAAFFGLGLNRLLSLDYLKAQQESFRSFYVDNAALAIGVFFAVYVVTTALSLPGAAILTLVAGALFGITVGTLVVSFASTLGAFLAFLSARFLLRDWVQCRFGEKLAGVNEGFRRDGVFYLFTLRVIPAVPFFVINLAMGLVPIRPSQFFWVSQVGMLPGTLVFVNAGTQLGKITSLKGIVSLPIFLSLVALGVFPFVVKKLLALLTPAISYYSKAKGPARSFKKPRKYDYNVVVIGAGSAGLVTAYIAAAVKAKVALVERHKMGGDCLNTGCVPSKALIRSARVLSLAKRAKEFGFREGRFDFDFSEVMARVQKVIAEIEPHDSVERYTKLGVDCIGGEARIRSPYEVEVGGRVLTTRNIVIATGGRPTMPKIEGIEGMGAYTSDTLWTLRALPKRLLVLGGGPIGCELAQCFARFGATVTMVNAAPRLLSQEDDEVGAFVEARFRAEGITVWNDHRTVLFSSDGGRKVALCDSAGKTVRVEFDELLVAAGRTANTKGFGLEELGVKLRPEGTIEADEFLRTNFPNIYVCGDVAGPYQFTHFGSHQAWYCAVHALFSPLVGYRADYRVLPRVTFTDPEVARVGLNEREAKEKGIPYEVTRYGMGDSDRAIAEGEARGELKVLTKPGKDTILGVTAIGEHAGEWFVEYVSAMKHGFGMNGILSTIHAYPTLAEANKYAAGNWKRAHAPKAALRFLEQFHSWRRGA